MNLFDKVQFINSFDEDNFVGLKYKKESINIYLPLGYDINRIAEGKIITSIEIKTRILLLLKSISLIKSFDNSKNSFGQNVGENKEIPFNSFLWIINDYLNNGLYQEIDKKYDKKNHGKINWKKTLNSEHYFSDNNVIFINPYYETNFQKDNLITELNNYCVKISCDFIGFLFGNITLPDTKINKERVRINKKYYLNLLNKELMHSFNDRKKILLSHMKRIIDMSYDEDFETQGTYGTYRYEYVWEKIVNETLGTKSINISDYFPEAYWNIINKDKEKDKSKLRPDTILKDKQKSKLYILDAKYYKYGITSNMKDLPHTDSIQKQITYGDHIANNNEIYKINSNNIFNAFILPYNKNKNNFNLNNNIEYLGFAESDWRKKTTSHNYEKIALIFVDTKYLIDCYFKKDKFEIQSLIKSIEKVINQ